MFRTHTCGQLNEDFIDQEVTLCGWVHRRRDHGGVIFIDLRDRYGLTQIVSDPIDFKEAHDVMDQARSEFVLQIKGKVRLRPGSNQNPNMKTGAIEITVLSTKIISASITPPFEIDQSKDISEDIRLKYRYLDLRKDRLKNNLILRHKIIKFIRDSLDQLDFIEVETPILIKGTPEGSREYIVPSRIYPGNFYVLPQSPQQLKQLLMIGGFDRYFQIARCFRDEDQRGDRQPEFTQLDMEMSFIDMEDIMSINEKLILNLTELFCPEKKILQTPFPRMTYKEAMDNYGKDSPDIRFEMKLTDITDIAKDCDFEIFKKHASNGGAVKALKVEGGAKFSRKEIDDLTEIAKIYGAMGLSYILLKDGEIKSSILKHLKEDEILKIIKECSAKDGDLILIAADIYKIACESLGAVRLKLAREMGLIDDNLFAFCWVTDFPMFEKNKDTGKLDAVHHPFTAPLDTEIFLSKPEEAIAKAYDIVLNGTEVGGGSIRIHEDQIQKKVFEFLGISEEDAERRFGHMLQAFQYGAPPHGGIAWGLDRLIMIFANEPNIREVIAFPKDQRAKDLMLGAPSLISEEQIHELGIKVLPKI